MSLDEVVLKLGIFGTALDRLESILAGSRAEAYWSDALIQRFEFTYELAWKALKEYLVYVGIEAKTPRGVFKEAFSLGLLESGELWFDMLSDRNLTSHTYQEAVAKRICERVELEYAPELRKLFSVLEGELK